MVRPAACAQTELLDRCLCVERLGSCSHAGLLLVEATAKSLFGMCPPGKSSGNSGAMMPSSTRWVGWYLDGGGGAVGGVDGGQN